MNTKLRLVSAGHQAAIPSQPTLGGGLVERTYWFQVLFHDGRSFGALDVSLEGVLAGLGRRASEVADASAERIA